MSATPLTWSARYGAALGDYLETRTEEALQQAYALGREAITSGVSVLEVASVHHNVLAQLLGRPGAPPDALMLGSAFFNECLSPFEMTQRGFQDAVTALRRLNETLEEHVNQRTEALRESEERFRQMADNIQEVFWMTDPAKRLTLYVSAAYETIWGHSRESLYTDPLAFLAAVHPDDRARVEAALARQASGDYDEEYRILRPDGSLRWIRDRAFPIRDAAGAVTYVAGIADDVTARREVDEERASLLAREREARSAAELAERRKAFLADATRHLVLSFDSDANFAAVATSSVPAIADVAVVLVREPGRLRPVAAVAADPHVAALVAADPLGCLPAPGAPWGPLHALERGEPELQNELDASALGAAARDDEHRARLETVGYRSAVSVPLAARGETLGVLLLATAGSGRRYGQEDLELCIHLARRMALALDNARLYREAEQALRVRDIFLSVASHELKTPLTSLLGNVQLLQRRALRDGFLPQREQRLLQAVRDQALRLNSLVERLLDLSRIETGQLSIERAPVDLRELTARVVDELQPSIERHTLDVALCAEPVDVIGDALRLEQVLQNLIHNAVKYSPNGGRVAVELGTRDGHATIAVTDEGIGIPPDAQMHIFGRFYRADNAATSRLSGMGLGLFIVQEIVRLHGGRVEVASSEGTGSTFTVWLPLQPADAADTVPLPREAVPGDAAGTALPADPAPS
jgi:PAS domain S-box-containing protein